MSAVRKRQAPLCEVCGTQMENIRSCRQKCKNCGREIDCEDCGLEV